MPLILVELAYQAIEMATSDLEPSFPHVVELVAYSSLAWDVYHSSSNEFLDTMMPLSG